jgi:hypothetical protein
MGIFLRSLSEEDILSSTLVTLFVIDSKSLLFLEAIEINCSGTPLLLSVSEVNVPKKIPFCIERKSLYMD